MAAWLQAFKEGFAAIRELFRFVPKVRRWGVLSKAAKEADAEKSAIDAAIDAPARVPNAERNAKRER